MKPHTHNSKMYQSFRDWGFFDIFFFLFFRQLPDDPSAHWKTEIISSYVSEIVTEENIQVVRPQRQVDQLHLKEVIFVVSACLFQCCSTFTSATQTWKVANLPSVQLK